MDERPKLEELLGHTEGWRGAEVFAEGAKTGDGISKADLNAIRKFTRTDIDPEKLYVFPVLAIDDQPTRNMVRYTAESQKATIKDWVGIPFLFNSTGNSDIFASADHRLAASSQYARIYKSSLVSTPKGHTGTLVWVYTARGVDDQVESFINKLDVGILREVSIHVRAIGGVQCSICKVPFGDEKCRDKNHYPGEKFDGKMCYMETVGKMEPLELSSVACPGSVIAHVMDESEVPKYKLLSMREALGGSRATLEAIMAESNEVVATENELEEGATPTTDAPVLTENAPAGDPPADPAVTTEGKKTAEDDEEEADPPEDDDDDDDKKGKKAKKEAFVIFEGHCVACGRDGAAPQAEATKTEEELIAGLREQVQTQVNEIVEAAKTKIDAAEAERDAAIARAEQFDAIFKDIVKETVDLAVDKGVKEPAQREDYTSELSALDYSALKVVRETLAAAANKPEAKRKKLEESIAERYTRQSHATQTTTTAEGKTASTSQRKLFATKTLGPTGERK